MEEYLGVGFLYCDIIIFDEKGLATGWISEGAEAAAIFFAEAHYQVLAGQPGIAQLKISLSSLGMMVLLLCFWKEDKRDRVRHGVELHDGDELKSSVVEIKREINVIVT